MTDPEILKAVYAAVDEVNEGLPAGHKIHKSADTPLFASIDSLSLVSLVVASEDKIQKALNRPIVLTDEKAMSQARSPFRTLQTLCDYIETLLRENSVGQKDR